MRVLLDISTLGLGTLHPHARGGGFRADEHLVRDLAASPECEFAVCANHSSVTSDAAAEYMRAHRELARVPFLTPSNERASLARRVLKVGYRSARAIFPRGSLPNVVRSSGQLLDRAVHRPVVDMPGGADIFHSTHFPLPPRPRGRSPQRFLTIYDARYRRFAELYDARSRAVFDAIVESVGPRDFVITCSHASRDELVALTHIEARQIFVVPLAAERELFYAVRDVDALRRVRARYGIGDAPYLLSVSSVDIRKNTHQAVRAFARFVRQHRDRELRYVIAGSPGSGSAEMEAALDEAADVRDRIVQTGFVADEDLAALYSGAIAFLYPSLYEGFGLPPLEAMQCGTPVIASNSSSLPEVVGDAGTMVNVMDVDALCSAMHDVVTNATLRASLSQKALERAAAFTWEKTSAAVLTAYRTSIEAR